MNLFGNSQPKEKQFKSDESKFKPSKEVKKDDKPESYMLSRFTYVIIAATMILTILGISTKCIGEDETATIEKLIKLGTYSDPCRYTKSFICDPEGQLKKPLTDENANIACSDFISFLDSTLSQLLRDNVKDSKLQGMSKMVLDVLDFVNISTPFSLLREITPISPHSDSVSGKLKQFFTVLFIPIIVLFLLVGQSVVSFAGMLYKAHVGLYKGMEYVADIVLNQNTNGLMSLFVSNDLLQLGLYGILLWLFVIFLFAYFLFLLPVSLAVSSIFSTVVTLMSSFKYTFYGAFDTLSHKKSRKSLATYANVIIQAILLMTSFVLFGYDGPQKLTYQIVGGVFALATFILFFL